MLRQFLELLEREEVSQRELGVLREIELGALGDRVEGSTTTTAMRTTNLSHTPNRAMTNADVDERRSFFLADLGEFRELGHCHLLHLDLSGGGFISNLTMQIVSHILLKGARRKLNYFNSHIPMGYTGSYSK